MIPRLFVLGARAYALVLLVCVGCAGGVDGLRQACANTDTVLTGGYQLATAGMKEAMADGKAKQLRGCFEDLVAALDAAAAVKEGVCAVGAPSSPTSTTAARVTQAGADVAAAIAKFHTCSTSGGG